MTERKVARLAYLAMGGAIAAGLLYLGTQGSEKVDNWQPPQLPTQTWEGRYRARTEVIDMVTGETVIPTTKYIYKCPYGERIVYEPQYNPPPNDCSFNRTEVELR